MLQCASINCVNEPSFKVEFWTIVNDLCTECTKDFVAVVIDNGGSITVARID